MEEEKREEVVRDRQEKREDEEEDKIGGDREKERKKKFNAFGYNKYSLLFIYFAVWKEWPGLPSTADMGFVWGSERLLDENATTVLHSTQKQQ